MKKRKYLTGLLVLAFVFSLVTGNMAEVMAKKGKAENVSAAGKSKQKKVLVVYFSATGTTKSAAQKVKKASGGTLYEIEASNPYTSADLNYNNDDCRANTEQRDDSARPEIKGKVDNIKQYDVIFIGYPIWWEKEPMIIRTFLESYNLEGKRLYHFVPVGEAESPAVWKG